MPDPTELRESLQKAVLESYRDEYKELSETWRNLESKAQGAVTIAGIFIAGAFAYIREVGPQAHRSDRVFLGASILSLMISVLLSIWALRVRTVAAPPIGEYVDNLVRDLLQVDNDAKLKERVMGFVTDQTDSWRRATRGAKESNKSKANYLLASHVFLVIAILTVALLSISKLWR